MSDKNIENNSSNPSLNPLNKRNSFKGFFATLGILSILGSAFGGYLYFQSNLEGGLGSNTDGKTAQAANIL